MPKVPVVVGFCRAKRDPLVTIVLSRLLLDPPPEVVQEEGHRSSDPREVVVIEEDHASPAEQTTEVEEIEEHAVEPVVPIHESEVELASRLEEGRQGDLGHLIVMLHERADTRFGEHLEPAVRKPSRLERIENYMPGGRIS